MDAMSALAFLRPHALWALAVLPLLAWWWLRRRRGDALWRDSVDAHLLPHLLERGAGGGRGHLRLVLLLATAALAIVALAGPSWRSTAQPLHVAAAPLVVVLELSTAMDANDLPPSRLAQARARVAELLRARAGGQVGLVVFAEDAYTVAPLTDDAANVALFLDALQPSIMPVDGSRPSRGIGRARMLLDQAGFARGDILLLAADADGAAADAAREAAAAGARVSVLGLGTAQGASYRRRSGEIARTALDADALAAVAAAGGGGYRAVGPGDLAALGVRDARTTGEGDAQASGTARVALDGGFWLLPPLMLLALLAFRRGAPLAVLACVLCWPLLPAPAGAQARPADPSRAAPAEPPAAGAGPALPLAGASPAAAPAAPPRATPWTRRDQAEYREARRGETAFRAGDFAGAERAWAAVPGADADYNRGNALARAGRYEDAIAAYDAAIAASPRGHADATANRAAVAAALKRKPPPGPQDGSRGEQGEQDGQGKPQPDPSADASGESGAQGDDPDARRGDPGQRPPPGAQPRPQPGAPPDDASPTDGERDAGDAAQRAADQRAADAAQRDRMRGAGDGGDPDDAPADDGERRDGTPDRSESQADRERRRAQEAWLRRVPDDPGALLRARFLLEHERRQRGGGP